MGLTAFLNKTMLGIDIGSHAVKVVETRFSEGKAQVLRAVCEQIDFKDLPQGDRRKVYVAALRKIIRQNRIRTRKAVIAIPASDADARIIKFQDDGGVEEAGSGRPHPGPADMHFGTEETETYTQPLKGMAEGGGPEAEVLLVTGNRGAIVEKFEIAREAGLDPVIADVDIFAALNIYMLEYAPPREEAVILLDIGANTTNIAIVQNGMVKVVRTLFLAGSNFTRTLQHKLNISHGDAEALKRKYGLSMKGGGDEKSGEAAHTPGAQVYDLLSSQVKQISGEIVRTFAYLTERMPAREIHISKVALVGDSADMPGLADYLSGELEAPVEIFRPLEKLDLNRLGDRSCAGLPGFAAAAGLSLRGAGDDSRTLTRVNLLPKELLKKTLPAARIAASFLALALLLAGYWYHSFEEKTEALLLKSQAESAASRIRFRKIKRTAKTAIAAASVKPHAAKEQYAYLKELTISGVFTDSSGASAFLGGPGKSFVVKNGKMYDENGDLVPGISVSITRTSVILSGGAEKYELPIPE